MKTLVVVICFCLLPGLCWGGEKYEDLTKYYPMFEGDIWIYTMFGETPDEVVTVLECSENMSEGCLHEHILNGAKLHDAFQYIGNTVSRTYTSNFMTGEIMPLTPAQIYLKSPLIIGTTWKYKDNDELVKLKLTKILPKMKVIAGEYNNVIVVESVHYEHNKKETLRQYIYYAPNIGMIKTEARNIKVEKGKKLITTRELIEFRPSLRRSYLESAPE